MSARLSNWIAARRAAGAAVVLVTVAQARGSAPRDAGTVMAVTADALSGTIGGGRLEWEALARAREILAAGRGGTDSLDLPLGPALEQCCGGHVVLKLALVDDAALARVAAAEREEAAALPQVAVFGAGNVGQALLRALRPLPLRRLWHDRRADIFPAGTDAETDRGDPLDLVGRLAPGAAVAVMTHDHGLDFKITEAALARGDLAYVGLIGSRTKGRRFERWFVARGGDPRRLDDLTCPIGDFGLRDKRPAVIAALAAAEVMTALAEHLRARQIHDGSRFGGGTA
ncbi:MAG: xanthine dehydrogenase accessory protein XdhC [Kiloniellaceae bacterium]